MGEIAEDCYDRALDELDMLAHDPDCYGGRGFDYARPSVHRAPFRQRVASVDDFDNLNGE